MTSSRYAIPVIILLVLALIPTILHSYIDAKINDGKSVNDIAKTLNDFTSIPANRNTRWGMDIFGSEDWFERDYQDKQYNNVRLFAARAYDHKRLYHHPELALSYGHNLDKKSIQNLPDHTDIPVFVLNSDNNSMLVAYVLLYDDEFIKSPIDHQLGESMRLLANPRKPMTLLYASQSELASNNQFSQSAVASILSLAIQNYLQPSKSSSTEEKNKHDPP